MNTAAKRMTNMAQIETVMFESVTAKTKNLSTAVKLERPKRECRSRKRSFDIEQYSSKRPKYDQIDVEEQIDSPCTFGLTLSDTDDENDNESKCSTSDDTEPLSAKQLDENSDIEEGGEEEETTNVNFSKPATDQHRHIPVVATQSNIQQQQQALSRYSKRLISQFKYMYDQGLRKSIQATNSSDNSNSQHNEVYLDRLRWDLRNTFNRIDLFKEGYCVLSNEPFPFYSLCYMCGSTGNDLIYCSCCCEAYHPACLNNYERPQLNSLSELWLCPNCNVCNICGLLTHQNFLSRMTSEQSPALQLISCFDCKRNFHIRCIKKFKDEQLNELNNLTNNMNNNSVVALSRLSNSYLLSQTWFCPSCIRCDCGQTLISNDRNILSSLTKTFSSQQALMCLDCFNSMKQIRIEKNDNIEKCHLCEKYIEQIFSKQQQKQINYFLQCSKCKNRFHPKCDGYLNEDADIIPHIKHLCLNVMCSKCNVNEKDNIRKQLLEYKLQSIKSILSNVFSTLQVALSDEDLLNKIQSYIFNLQQLHESREQLLNLHIFLSDLLIIIRRLLTNTDIYRWQAAIDGCIVRQCPWFKSSLLLLFNNNKAFSHTSSMANHNFHPPPSADHTYAFNNEYSLNEKSTKSLLNYLDKNPLNEEHHFRNLHNVDTRKCQICQTLSDHQTSNIGRLISFGVNQWVHVGCILPAYAKNLDQPPYILRNIRETVYRCQTKYVCAICSKLGASVHCNESECYQRFHCECIQKYYLNVDKSIQEQLNIKNGYLSNLTTLCLRHNGLRNMNASHRDSVEKTNENESKELPNNASANPSKMKCVNTLSTVYGDLSNNVVEFALVNTRLCIGSLQIESLGNFEYQIDKVDEDFFLSKSYPNGYRASRLFWSMNNPRQKTIYRLHIQVEQTYHNDESNHKVVEHPMTEQQAKTEQLYELCRKHFRKIQNQIDQHSNYIEEFCQRTSISKKPVSGQTTYRRRGPNAGTALTKRVPKATPSCVKRQTSKAALKNVSRPRNRFAQDKKEKIPLVTQQNPIKDNTGPPNDIRNLFHEEFLKSANVSQFALALVQALQQVGQSTKAQQPESNLINSSLNPINHPMNGVTTERNNDFILKQLLKSITTPQQLNDSQGLAINSLQTPSCTSYRRSSTSTQTEVISLPKPFDSSPYSHSPVNGTIPLVHTTDNSSIPQVDGSIDDDDDDLYVSSVVLHSLIEQIIDQNDSEYFSTNSEHLMDLSDTIPTLLISDFASMSPMGECHAEMKSPVSSDDLIKLYKKWVKSNFSLVKFTITNDEGYKIVSDDLDEAWSTIIELIRNCRDDMNLPHLPMTNNELSGHKIFGLTKPTIQTMLNQMYSNQQQDTPVTLPLSASSSLNSINANSIDNLNKKKSSSCSRSGVYERKMRERPRFGWLLNQSRKVEYALKSFEVDNALAYARRILLEEASVSLRLYHLHYFSERALLVATSPIHGCGLFTLVDLVEGQMIIEYTGEVVRPCLTDKRERENEGKGFGCYMFTVDSMNVIDATHRGNKARFINHNCEPNCFAKTVLSGGVKHIVIYALMDIPRGSELTYDYSFPEEDVKIPCHCGTSKCRVYLN